MRRQQLLTIGEDEACAGCDGELRAGSRAWWDVEERLWTCTACVPPDEATRHSVAHVLVRSERSYSGLF